MELFLYTVAWLLHRERYEVLDTILSETYVVSSLGGEQRKRRYGTFWFPLESIEQYRNQRLKLRITSPVALLLKQRDPGTEVGFDSVKQVEFLLFLRHTFLGERGKRWKPRTLAYSNDPDFPSPLPLFHAAESPRRFRRLQAMLKVRDVAQLVASFEESYPTPESRYLKLGDWPISLVHLANMHELSAEKFGDAS